MDAVERAVRAALDKGNAEDRAFRMRIYASAQSALERSLAARNAPADQVDQRRRHLAAIIAGVEADFVPAMAADHVDVAVVAPPTGRMMAEPAAPVPEPFQAAPAQIAEPVVEPVAVPVSEPQMQASPSVAPPSSGSLRTEPAFMDPVLTDPAPRSAAPMDHQAGLRDGAAQAKPVAARQRAKPATVDDLIGGKPERPRSRWRWFSLAANAALLLALVLGGWWLYAEGMRQYQAATTDAPSSSAPVLAEPGTDPAAAARLLDVFRPQNADQLSVPSGAEARLVQRDGADALSIRATAPGAAVGFAVGEGALREFAGRRVLFSITARAEGAGTVDTGVTCALAGLATCDRTRFRVTPGVAEYVLVATLAGGAPQGNGVITIEPDLSGGAAAIEILGIRMGEAQSE
ncbi:MAG: hypothetical protein MUC58_10435 [Rhizobiaceae bacterium]|nr:hypothetical protein [Rhizobiaceae bacterium]